ncbi:transcriptional regulator [Variovorax sp. GT1P44]|uniref:transcriptional regulator n=1 Tax=Variovorax sp. GT1P44 TaxID=3443742 RepID=UPI003F488D9E
MNTPEKHPLSLAADIVGTQQRLCDLIGVKKGALSQWKLPGRNVPADKCGPIERATGGRVDCETLRPDIDWGIYRTPKSARRIRRAA